MNIISFSLYGENPKYLVGAIENAKTIQQLMPNWTARFYCGDSISKSIIQELEMAGAETRIQESNWHSNGMFWRYLPIGESGISYIAFRDVDSRLGERDLESINKWLESHMFFHIIRDHPFHQTPILGGLWGIKNWEFDTSVFWILASRYSTLFGEDQRFLATHIYPIVRKNALIHDPFFEFEPKRMHQSLDSSNLSYMGESFSELGEVDVKLRLLSAKYQSSKRLLLILRMKTRLQSQFISYKAYLVSKRSLPIPKR